MSEAELIELEKNLDHFEDGLDFLVALAKETCPTGPEPKAFEEWEQLLKEADIHRDRLIRAIEGSRRLVREYRERGLAV